MFRIWVSSLGTVRAQEYQHLTFEVDDEVTYLANCNGRRLREGDRVQEGELLARVDDRELLADVQQAQAAVAEAKQQKAAAAADVAQGQALALAIFMVFAVLVLQFGSFRQPFIILLAIPFAFIGKMGGLFLAWIPFSFPTPYTSPLMDFPTPDTRPALQGLG